MKKLFVLAVILGFVACTRLIAPTQADAERAAAKWPGITVNELAEGKHLYETNCGKCHNLKKPTSRSEEQWRKIVPKMAKKAKIDAEKEQKILKYVITMSEAKK